MQDSGPGARGQAVYGAGGCCFASLTAVLGSMQFGVLVDWWMLFCELAGRVLGLDGRVLGGMQFGVLVDAVLRAGRVLGGMQFGVLLNGRGLGGMQFGVLVDAALRA